MSKISTIQDELRSVVASLFPMGTKLDDPILIENNTTDVLGHGYGVAVGIGNNTNRVLSCNLSMRRDFIVTLTRCVEGSSENPTDREAAEKTILEDQFTLLQEIEKNPSLNNTAAKINFLSDNGIEQVFDTEYQSYYLMIQMTFEIEYFENL